VKQSWCWTCSQVGNGGAACGGAVAAFALAQGGSYQCLPEIVAKFMMVSLIALVLTKRCLAVKELLDGDLPQNAAQFRRAQTAALVAGTAG
jgi:hypothetical protein